MSASRSALIRSYAYSASCSPASWVIVISFQARTRHSFSQRGSGISRGHQARPEWAKWGTDGTGIHRRARRRAPPRSAARDRVAERRPAVPGGDPLRPVGASRDLVDRRVTAPAVVEDLDPLEDRVLRLRTRGEAPTVDELPLERGEEALTVRSVTPMSAWSSSGDERDRRWNQRPATRPSGQSLIAVDTRHAFTASSKRW